jgi:hypothetical protein
MPVGSTLAGDAKLNVTENGVSRSTETQSRRRQPDEAALARRAA